MPVDIQHVDPTSHSEESDSEDDMDTSSISVSFRLHRHTYSWIVPEHVPSNATKYHSRCDETLTEDATVPFILEFLSKLSITYDQTLGVVVCPALSCQCPVPYDTIWSHCFVNLHWKSGVRPPTWHVFTQWLVKAGLDKDINEYTGQIVTPPPGVKVINARICNHIEECQNSISYHVFPDTDNSFHRHYRNKKHHPIHHPTDQRGSNFVKAFSTSHVHKNRRYIQATPPAPDSQSSVDILTSSILDPAAQRLQDHRNSQIFQGYNDHRQAPPWVYFTRWDKYIERNDLGLLRSLLDVPKDSVFARLSKPIHTYYEEANESVRHHLDEPFREALGTSGR